MVQRICKVFSVFCALQTALAKMPTDTHSLPRFGQCNTEHFCNVEIEDNLYAQNQEAHNSSKATQLRSTVSANQDPIHVFTVATEYTDGYQRYLHTAREFSIKPHVLGMGQKWQGGENIRLHPGGGWKVNLLKKALEKYKADNQLEQIVLFTDGYDVIFLSDLSAIYQKFIATGARILFGAEASCWPDKSLSNSYPEVTLGKRYLNSGLFIGYVRELLDLLSGDLIDDKDDDQLFFSRAFINAELRERLHIKLDHESALFQNLNGAVSEVQLTAKSVTLKDKEGERDDTLYEVTNFLTQSHPLILHGNGPSKMHLNAFANYLSRTWSPQGGCRHCLWDTVSLEGLEDGQLPLVLLALFIEAPTPFMLEQLQKIDLLDYPKSRVHLFIHNNAKYHQKLVEEFISQHKGVYASIKQITPDDEIHEWTARDLSLDQCVSKSCDFYFSVDSIAHIDNPATLRDLIAQNRSVIAPALTRPGKAWSNFWGALTNDGFYARSNDYLDLVHNKRRGLWNMPFVANCYLINGRLLRRFDRSQIHFVRENLDADMAFAANLRDLDVFMYVSNRKDFGHLVNPESFDIDLATPDMYQIFDNQRDWEARYIHPDFASNFDETKKPSQPCPDVYWFPIVSKDFTNDLIFMMEAFGKWSDGSNDDTRLEGGYEAVPTRDIHMNQVGWERHWLYFLQQYVRPLQEHVFTGYIHDPPRSLMNFVVRYRPDEQPSLRPHHDSSTYTINIALNQRGVDYEGGGCRFIRYNCSVVDTKPGWLLLHPGRLTHYHEGLLVTKGTRYIMIAFVDP